MPEPVVNTFPMTTAEYDTAALLLGLRYSPRCHAYMNSGATELYDPETMELLWSLEKGDSLYRVVIDRRMKTYAGYHRR